MEKKKELLRRVKRIDIEYEIVVAVGIMITAYTLFFSTGNVISEWFKSISVKSSEFVDKVVKTGEEVELLYFTNPKCKEVNKTDVLMERLEDIFGDKLNVKRIIVKIFTNDPEDSAYVKQLRDKYAVYGVPTLVVNGELVNKSYTEDNLIKEICNNLITKPSVCT